MGSEPLDSRTYSKQSPILWRSPSMRLRLGRSVELRHHFDGAEENPRRERTTPSSQRLRSVATYLSIRATPGTLRASMT